MSSSAQQNYIQNLEDTTYVSKVLPHSPGRRANNHVHSLPVNDWLPHKLYRARTDNTYTNQIWHCGCTEMCEMHMQTSTLKKPRKIPFSPKSNIIIHLLHLDVKLQLVPVL